MGYSSLEIGKRALAASQAALEITGNNIANVNTEGYSRRVAVLSETDPYRSNTGFMGTGVLIDKIKNFREEFFDKEIRATESRKTAFETDSKIYKAIEGILAEPSDIGFNELITEFLNAFEDLAIRPEDIALRQNTLMLAENLVDRFRTTANQLSELKYGLIQNVEANIEEANLLIKDIAGLNKEVLKAITFDGAGSQTYIDERERKLEELSKLVDLRITYGNLGAVNVFVNGINIITGAMTTQLKTREKVGSSGEMSLQMIRVNNDKTEAVLRFEGGELGSLLKHFNETLNADSKADGFSIVKSLDDLAAGLVSNVNNFTVSGYGLNDRTSPAPGRNFFEPAVGKVTASTIEISKDILGRPENIPLSSKPNEPGNNEIARNIGRIALDKKFINDMSPSEYYSNVLGKLGQLSRTAKSGSETTAIVSEQLLNQRESIIGVNLDEEAINLIKYQKAFEASARIINATTELLKTIINLGR